MVGVQLPLLSWLLVAHTHCSDGLAQIANTDALTMSSYDASVTSLLKQSRPLDTANVGDCLAGKGLGFYLPATTG